MSGLLLMTFSIYGADRPIGASTYVSYFAGIIFDLDPKEYTYLREIKDSGAWDLASQSSAPGLQPSCQSLLNLMNCLAIKGPPDTGLAME